ncbi:MAG: hypothetical protein OJF49_004279 [Ktedonobacterales bacterium]|jgi:hypothetical protein|nr:MAG: hypothetical protein OJF49_004279 [Ktedonobacterales bacterium]
MLRKDPAQDMDRPHYYSQYWIDVAFGQTAGAADSVDAAPSIVSDHDAFDEDAFEEIASKPAPRAKPPKAPEKKPEPTRPVLTSLADLANIDQLMKSSAEMGAETIPDIESGEMEDLEPFGQEPLVAGSALPSGYSFDDGDTMQASDEDLDDELEFDDEEEEEDDEWGGGRKPHKPQKPQRPKRERRPY